MAYVYRFIDKKEEIIYIGKANDLEVRFKGHDHLPLKCYKEVKRVEFTRCNTEDDSLLLERYLIAKIKPKYNTIYKYNELTINISIFDDRTWERFNVNFFDFLNKEKEDCKKIAKVIATKRGAISIKDVGTCFTRERQNRFYVYIEHKVTRKQILINSYSKKSEAKRTERELKQKIHNYNNLH